jgi:hypothetical protein
MTEAPSIYFPEKSPDLDTIYQNEVLETFYYWPLAVTQSKLALNPSGLATATTDVYYTYSGVSWQYTTAARQKDGRYRNITLRTISGDPFLFYITTKMTTDDGLHHAGPVSISGSYYTLTKYSSIEEAETNAIEFTSAMNSGIFTLTETEQARMITLAHRSVSGESYRLYQFLPRTSIEVDDLSAEVIDVVTLRVSDSIVVSPNIPNKSITGDKILDGTVSGVIITPGTITSNEIAAGTITGNKIAANTISGALITAGTITADKLQVGNLEALSANTGSLNVTNTVTVTSGQINAGLVQITQSGISVGNVATELTETNAIRIYGKINPSGGNVVGLALYNNINPYTPHAVFQTDFDNAVEIENLAPDGVTNINIPQGDYVDAFNVWIADPDEPQFSVGYDYTDVRNELYLSNNLTMAAPSGIATLKETVVEGNLEVIGDVLTSSTGITSSDVTIDVPTTINSGLTLNGDLTGNLFINSALTDSAPCLYFRRDATTTLPAVNSYIDINFTTFIKNSAFTYNSSTAVFTFLYSGWYMFSIHLFTSANQQTYFRTDTNYTFANYYHTTQNVWSHTLGPLFFGVGNQLKFRGGANASVTTPQISLFVVRVA